MDPLGYMSTWTLRGGCSSGHATSSVYPHAPYGWRVLRGWFDDINPRGSFKVIYRGTFKGFFLRDL